MSTINCPADSLKMIRETLCIAQTHVNLRVAVTDRRQEHSDRLQRLINDIDRQRPLGPDGKHGDRHTPTCGCEDVASPSPVSTPDTRDRLVLPESWRQAFAHAEAEEFDAARAADREVTVAQRAAFIAGLERAAELITEMALPAATEEPPKLIDVPEDSMEREPPCPGSEHGGSDFVVDPWCPECARTAPLDWTCAPCAALYAAQSGGVSR